MTSIRKPLITLNKQHDYITLKTPNGNFTASFNGEKATGKLGKHNTAFNSIRNYIKGFKTVGEAMENLTNPKVLETLWPEWNEKVEENLFLPGNNVEFNPGLFKKKYPNGGNVVQVKRKNVYIRLVDTNQVIGFDYQELILKK